jgi:alkanesulfonate monooxygenase
MASRVEDRTMGGSKLSGIDIFSTCPASSEVSHDLYLQQVINTARWSEAWGCAGTLIDAGNSLVDPWLVAYTIIRYTRTLCPLVAVQPLYMHPYAVAKIVSTIGCLYGRRVLLNLDPDSFENDLAPNDSTPSDSRNDRLVEYTLVIKKLLGSPAPLTYHGRFYTVDQVRLIPAAPPELFPGIFVSAPPETGANAAARLGAIAVKSPKMANEEAGPSDKSVKFAIRIGILAREDASEAWKIAHTRFPEDRRGRSTQLPAMKAAGTPAHEEGVLTGSVERGPYWLGPFRHNKTMCPYLVGSYEEVAGEIAKYVGMGYRTFILDLPPNAEEFGHVAVVFSQLDSFPRKS